MQVSPFLREVKLMGKKRSHGEGSVFQYRGRWRAAIRVNYRRLVRDFDTKREALSWLAEVRVQAERGLLPEPDRVTVAEFLRSWLEVVSPTVKPATADTYRQVAETRIIPELGQARLQGLKPADIQAFLAKLLNRGLSPASVRLTFAVLRRACRTAVDLGLLAVSPTDRVRPPRVGRRDFPLLGPEDVARLLAAVRQGSPGLYPVFALLATTGIRVGEARALTWDDVDLEGGRVLVRRTIRRIGGRWVITEPKSAAGRRQVTIPAELIPVLKEQRRTVLERRLRAGAAWDSACGDLVFPTETGRPLPYRAIREALVRACRAAGLPELRVHDLRHLHATCLLAFGVNVRAVAERLGHSQPGVTLSLYAHLTPGLQEQAAELAGRLLPRSGTG